MTLRGDPVATLSASSPKLVTLLPPPPPTPPKHTPPPPPPLVPSHPVALGVKPVSLVGSMGAFATPRASLTECNRCYIRSELVASSASRSAAAEPATGLGAAASTRPKQTAPTRRDERSDNVLTPPRPAPEAPRRARPTPPGALDARGRSGSRRHLIETLRNAATWNVEEDAGGAEDERTYVRASAGGRMRLGSPGAPEASCSSQRTPTGCGPHSSSTVTPPSMEQKACIVGEDAAARQRGAGHLSYVQPSGRPPGAGRGRGRSGGGACSADRDSPIVAPLGKRARRISPPHGGEEVAARRIRGQSSLLGTRGAGNQCAEGIRGLSSIEDGKIHLDFVHAGRIRSTACQGRAAAGEANATAADVAARHVAWHSTAPAESPSGGG